jgi:RNA polymerase sigma factor (sigma-70 family)
LAGKLKEVVSMTTATIGCSPAGRTKSTAELLTAINEGDPAAWDEIIRRYNGLVSATVRSFRLQEADSLDAIQSTWLRLAENMHRLREPERLGGWLVTTARRECLHILRNAKNGPDLSVATETVADPSASPEQRTVNSHTSRILWRLVDDLCPRQRSVLRMLFADRPFPYDTVARTVGIPLGGIGPTRARALRQLRKKLDQYGIQLEL